MRYYRQIEFELNILKLCGEFYLIFNRMKVNLEFLSFMKYMYRHMKEKC